MLLVYRGTPTGRVRKKNRGKDSGEERRVEVQKGGRERLGRSPLPPEVQERVERSRHPGCWCLLWAGFEHLSTSSGLTRLVFTVTCDVISSSQLTKKETEARRLKLAQGHTPNKWKGRTGLVPSSGGARWGPVCSGDYQSGLTGSREDWGRDFLSENTRTSAPQSTKSGLFLPAAAEPCREPWPLPSPPALGVARCAAGSRSSAWRKAQSFSAGER